MTSCKSTIIFITNCIGTDYIISGYSLSTVPVIQEVLKIAHENTALVMAVY